MTMKDKGISGQVNKSIILFLYYVMFLIISNLDDVCKYKCLNDSAYDIYYIFENCNKFSIKVSMLKSYLHELSPWLEFLWSGLSPINYT